MEGENAIAFIGVGADAAEVDDPFYSRLLDSLYKAVGKTVRVLVNIEIEVEKSSGRLHRVYGVGAFEGSSQKGGVFDGPDGGDRAQGFDGLSFIGVAADHRDGMALLNELFGEGFADIS